MSLASFIIFNNNTQRRHQNHDIYQSIDVRIYGRYFYAFDGKFFTNTCIMLCVFYQLKNNIGNYGH